MIKNENGRQLGIVETSRHDVDGLLTTGMAIVRLKNPIRKDEGPDRPGLSLRTGGDAPFFGKRASDVLITPIEKTRGLLSTPTMPEELQATGMDEPEIEGDVPLPTVSPASPGAGSGQSEGGGD